jgi:hypothetical protein
MASNKVKFARQVMLDIKDKVDTDARMITWRFCTSPHIAKGVTFRDLIQCQWKLPKVVIVVLANSYCMLLVSWGKNIKLVGRASSFSMELGLSTHPSWQCKK